MTDRSDAEGTPNGTIGVVSPLDSSCLGQVWETPSENIAQAVRGSKLAQGRWISESPDNRRLILLKVAQAIRDDEDELAYTESLNTGKPPVDTLREVRRAANCFEYYAGWVDHIAGETLPLGEDNLVYTIREPVGTVLGIVPWNMPFAFAAKKIAPALAFGNSCLIKPAPETPLTTLTLAEIVKRAGAPEGLVQVMIGGANLGRALVESAGIDLIAFTGSVETGKAISRAAAENLTPCILELGGNNAQIIFDDCNIDAALDAVMLGGFASTGQMCIAGSRIFVQSTIYAEFIDELSSRVSKLIAGDFRSPNVHLGPQTTLVQQRITEEAVNAAEKEGVKVGGRGSIHPDALRSNGFYTKPILFVDVSSDSELMKKEVFGPVVSVASFRNEEDALRHANDSAYGLASGIWTSNISRAHRLAKRVNAGTIWLNTYRVLNDRVPFGGVKDSGYGRENGSSAYTTYTQTKSVWASLNVGQTYGYQFGSD